MTSLDERGKLAVAIIAFYLPCSLFTVVLVLRHGFKRDAGWIFLLALAILRISFGVIYMAAELIRPRNPRLYATASIFQGIGVSPLLLATLAFLGAMSVCGFYSAYFVLRLLGMFTLVALVLLIDGGATSALDNANTSNRPKTIKRIGYLMFVALYILFSGVHIVFWVFRGPLSPSRRLLLKGISAALPFIGVRVVYGVLSVYSSEGHDVATTVISPRTSISKFNTVNGSWALYLTMSLLSEYIAVCIYIAVGMMIRVERVETEGQRSAETTVDTAQDNHTAHAGA
ncbi:hypothetical protein PLICRDRAFT_114872 [Plicaturopsis crispa FD-325 SS-3]|nr:hypothetical protein PLICRDRAFT_114872 [Plicaturopsis crispa FD-325 SS-3]